jgi:hypothetical protein
VGRNVLAHRCGFGSFPQLFFGGLVVEAVDRECCFYRVSDPKAFTREVVLPDGLKIKVLAEIDVDEVDSVGHSFGSNDVNEVKLGPVPLRALVLLNRKVYL